MNFTHSIVALSSGRLPAGLAVIRLSGPHCRFALETIVNRVAVPPRKAMVADFRNIDGERIDRGLLLFFPGPASFTGEDVVEFHVHGGRAVVTSMIEALTSIDGVRLAEPGEFTRRAFLNAKLDLVETEALADLIAAETEAQRRFAAANAGGAQSELYLSWRQRLVHARAMLEAEIDFADEDDVPGSVASSVWTDVEALTAEIQNHIDGFHAAEIIRDGFDVVIVGAPNAGKSSVFNALARRDVAIVTDEPGTTRDLLEVMLDLGGLPVRITDTAGLREGAGKVESIGIERAKGRLDGADLVLLLTDMVSPADLKLPTLSAAMLRIGTKLDLVSDGKDRHQYDMAISVKTEAGLDILLDELKCRAASAVGFHGDILPSRLRHVELLRRCREFLLVCLAGRGRGAELHAEDLRLAADQLGRIVGSIDVEELLDVIFGQFCIGK